MRKLSRLVAGAATMAVAAALVAGTVGTASAAPNDPPTGVAPKAFDIVAVGSNTTQYVLDALAQKYDAGIGTKHNAAHPFVYSFDAVKPGTSANAVTKISPKARLRHHRPAERLGRRRQGTGHHPGHQVGRGFLSLPRLRPLVRRPQADRPEVRPRRHRLRGVRP